MIDAAHPGRRSVAVVEPDAAECLLVIVTVYEVNR